MTDNRLFDYMRHEKHEKNDAMTTLKELVISLAICGILVFCIYIVA